MSNMTYCRFRNTLEDLRDCEDNMGEAENMDHDERQARLNLIKMCARISDDYAWEVEE